MVIMSQKLSSRVHSVSLNKIFCREKSILVAMFTALASLQPDYFIKSSQMPLQQRMRNSSILGGRYDFS